jgi:hypothetical protein
MSASSRSAACGRSKEVTGVDGRSTHSWMVSSMRVPHNGYFRQNCGSGPATVRPPLLAYFMVFLSVVGVVEGPAGRDLAEGHR